MVTPAIKKRCQELVDPAQARLYRNTGSSYTCLRGTRACVTSAPNYAMVHKMEMAGLIRWVASDSKDYQFMSELTELGKAAAA